MRNSGITQLCNDKIVRDVKSDLSEKNERYKALGIGKTYHCAAISACFLPNGIRIIFVSRVNSAKIQTEIHKSPQRK